MIYIYLAGGMKSKWQDEVMRKVPPSDHVRYLDPRANETPEFEEYTALDIFHLKNADIVFIYLEKENPAAHGLNAEAGFSRGGDPGKLIIVVNEDPKDTGEAMIRYRKFFECFASPRKIYSKLDEGVEFLAKAVKQYR